MQFHVEEDELCSSLTFYYTPFIHTKRSPELPVQNSLFAVYSAAGCAAGSSPLQTLFT